MQRTGPTKKETRKAIIFLEKKAKKDKKGLWKAVAVLLGRPTRKRTAVPLKKIARLAKRFPGKTMVVPGKILGNQCQEKVHTIALEYSRQAMAAIKKSGGTAKKIMEITKEEPKETMIVE